jgi:ABC-2 type transport system permease protein
VQFNAEIEKDILKVGDSHNPNDPYFKTLKDSLLTVYQVDSVQKLPINYGGFQMKEGEKISATIYNQHFDKLLTVYKDQNSFSKVLAFLNPFLAIKNLSMALSGTDYDSYINFQQQAEESRYEMAQKLNDLQIKYISNKAKTSAGKANIIDKNYWADLGDFHYKPSGIIGVFRNEFISIIALFFWIGILIFAIKISSKNLTAI